MTEAHLSNKWQSSICCYSKFGEAFTISAIYENSNGMLSDCRATRTHLDRGKKEEKRAPLVDGIGLLSCRIRFYSTETIRYCFRIEASTESKCIASRWYAKEKYVALPCTCLLELVVLLCVGTVYVDEAHIDSLFTIRMGGTRYSNAKIDLSCGPTHLCHDDENESFKLILAWGRPVVNPKPPWFK